MTQVPLPDISCVRVELVYSNSDGSLAGSRFFLSYSGTAPSAANCATLATDIATAWESNIASLLNAQWTLTMVDVIDISSYTGASGVADVSHAGSRSGTALPSQVAMNVEFNIARRYRGGKPRMFWPAGVDSDLADSAHWGTGFITAVNTQTQDFFTAVEGSSVGAMGTLTHVNLSFYQSFHNVTNSSGRIRAAPTYRATAIHDNVTGYSAKGVLGSQRRRRTAVTA